MKKVYEAPEVEIELYELDAAIALSCGFKVTQGPAYGTHSACDEFNFDMDAAVAAYSAQTSFYDEDNVCTCYYSSGGEGYFTS